MREGRNAIGGGMGEASGLVGCCSLGLMQAKQSWAVNWAKKSGVGPLGLGPKKRKIN